MGSPGAPEPTLGPKTPLNGPGRAKIGVNAPHVVQLTGLGPKKPNLNRSPTNSVLFTRNHPHTECALEPNSEYCLAIFSFNLGALIKGMMTCSYFEMYGDEKVLREGFLKEIYILKARKDFAQMTRLRR